MGLILLLLVLAVVAASASSSAQSAPASGAGSGSQGSAAGTSGVPTGSQGSNTTPGSNQTGSGMGYGSPGSGQGSVGSVGSTSDVSGSDQDILARTLYGEARNQGAQGLQAVANVIMNRSRDTLNFPDGISGVAAICQQPNQFSCWNANDPNLSIIESVTTSDPIFRQCLAIADQALNGTLPDITGGAEFYYAPGGMGGRVPNWVASLSFTTQIGAQRFYAYPSMVA